MSDNPSKMSFEQACLYVGLFMHHFSLLESSLNNGVGALLGINGPEQAIATANMNFYAKIHIVKAAVDLKGGDAEWAKDIQQIADFSILRNIVVHNVFGPNANGGIQFLTVKAKGKLSFPETIWSITDFERHFATAKSLRFKLDDILSKLEARRKENKGLLGKAMLASLLPAQHSHPTRQPLENQSSQQPNPTGPGGTA